MNTFPDSAVHSAPASHAVSDDRLLERLPFPLALAHYDPDSQRTVVEFVNQAAERFCGDQRIGAGSSLNAIFAGCEVAGLEAAVSAAHPGSQECILLAGPGSAECAPLRVDVSGLEYGVVLTWHACDNAQPMIDGARQTQPSGSGRQWQSALDAAGLGSWELDLNSRRFKRSARFDLLLGLSTMLRELSLSHLLRMVQEEDRARLQEEFNTAIEDRSDWRGEYRIVRPNGETRWVRIVGRCQYNSAGRAECMFGILEDINLRRSSMERLEQLRLFMHSSPFPVMIHADNGEILLVNSAWQQLSGYTKDQLPDVDSWLRLAYGHKAELVRRQIRNIYHIDQMGRDGEFRIKTADGHEAVWDFYSGPLGRDDQGRKLVLSTAVDVTERRAFETALRDSELRYRTLFENITEEVHFWKVVRDAQGEVVNWQLIDANPPSLRSWGKSIEDVKGKDADYIFGSGTTAQYLPIIKRIVNGREQVAFEDYLQNVGRYFRLTSVPLGEYFITTGTDITELKQAFDAVRESEARFRNMADAAPAMLWITNSEQRCIFLSRRWYEYTGLPQEETPDWMAACHPEDRPDLERLFRSAADQCQPFSSDYRLRTAQGGYRWVVDVARPLRGEDGEFQGYVGVLFDIHDRKVAEAELAKLSQQRQLALDAARLGWWAYNPESDRLSWDDRFGEIFGMTDREARGSDFVRYIHPDDQPDVAALSASAMNPQDPQPFSIVCRIRGSNGEERWIEAHGKVDFQGIGNEIRANSLVGTIADITDRKLAENELRRAHALIEGITLGTEDLIAAQDHEFRFLFFNEAYRAEFKRLWQRDPTVGDSMLELLADCPEQLEQAKELWQRALRGESFRTTAEFGQDPHRQFYDLRFSPVRDRNGKLIGAANILRNITAAKRAEIERELLLESERFARAEAERASRFKDEFLAMVSHELRTPLNAILGFAQLVRRGTFDVQRGIEIVERNARCQARLIEDLLDMSRVASGKLALAIQPVNLHEVIDRAVEAVRPAAQLKGVTIREELQQFQDLVQGDAARLQQVVWNLLTNAVKFTPNGGHVQVSLTKEVDAAILKVQDDGEGIDAKFLPHLFERFRQADTSIRRKHGGLGLGLALVRYLVEAHNGSVRVISDGPNCGSCFTICLPFSAGSNKKLAAHTQIALELAATVDLAQRRILIVDDERDATQLLAVLLEEHGAATTLAQSADEALGLIACNDFELIISDVGMPGMDGYEFIRRVRAMGRKYRSIPAVALTAFAREDDKRQALAAGFNAHLAKPFEPARLLRVIDETLRSKKSRRAKRRGAGE